MAQDQHPLSDDEIIAAERRKFKLRILIGLLVGSAFVLLIVLVKGMGAPNAFVDQGVRWFPLLLITVVAIVRWRLRSSPQARSERIVHKRMDEFQRRYRYALVAFTVLAGFYYFGFEPHGSFRSQALQNGCLALSAIALAGMICFPGWGSKVITMVQNDERMLSLRDHASRAGYLGLMVALGAIFLATQLQPGLVPLLVRAALFTGIAIPAVTFVFLDWRTGG